jgi:TRAP-type C4-dicarboxylate transport system permease small subunit
MAFLIFITFFGVIMRYFFNKPISWQEEIMVFLILWVVFIGASYCFRQKSHIVIDLFVDMMPDKIKKWASVFIQIVIIIVLSYIGYFGYKAIIHYDNMGNNTNILKIPYLVKYASIPIGCILMIFSSSWRFYKELTNKAFLPEKDKGEI